MSALTRQPAFAMLALALVPVSLCAWLAQFSRMLRDDFYYIALGRELGAWQLWMYFRNSWAGSYSDHLYFGFLAQLDSALPSVAVLVSIILWLASTAALATVTLARLTFRHTRVTGFAVAALIVGATISAIKPEVFYWYSANTRYILPLAVLTMYFALLTYATGRALTTKRQSALSLAGAAICFIAVGFSEMAALFQFALLLLVFIASIACADRNARAAIVTWLGAGMLGTCLGILVHLTAPGFQHRLAIPASDANPIRSISVLLNRSLDEVIQVAGGPEVFRGFMLLFFVGLLAALLLVRSNQCRIAPDERILARGPLVFGMITQLLLLPLLWTHVSDKGQVLGRFSYAYFSIVIMNAAFIILFACLLWQRQRLRLAIIQRRRGRLCAPFLSAILLQFALTQARRIDNSASFYLHISAVTVIVAFALSVAPEGDRSLRLSLLISAITATLLLIMIISSLRLQGYLVHRVVVAVITMHIVSGAIWGLSIGSALKVNFAGDADRLRYFAFLIALAIGAQVSLSLAGKTPNMASYAREWDTQHQMLLEAKAAGLRELELPRMRYLLHRFAVWQDFDHGRKMFEKHYYGLEQYACRQETCRFVFHAP